MWAIQAKVGFIFVMDLLAAEKKNESWKIHTNIHTNRVQLK